MPFDSELQEPKPLHRDFTGTVWSEAVRRQRQRKRLQAWNAECRRADKTPVEYKARAYALWLAERDGIEIPAGASSHCALAPVTEDDGVTRNRVYRVTFAGSVKIDIPNWDFVPSARELLPEPEPAPTPTVRMIVF